MKKTIKPAWLLVALLGIIPGLAKADNSLTEEQLLKATQLSLQDYATAEPEMTRSVSGFKVSTSGNNAVVVINMDADGMHMIAKYLCVTQGTDLSCHIQQ